MPLAAFFPTFTASLLSSMAPTLTLRLPPVEDRDGNTRPGNLGRSCPDILEVVHLKKVEA